MKIGASIAYEDLINVDKLIDAGYKNFEILFWGEFAPVLTYVYDLRDLAKEKQFEVVSVHFPNTGIHSPLLADGRDGTAISALTADIDAFEYYTTLNPPRYVIHPTHKTWPNALQNMIDNLNAAQEKTAAKVCLENLPKSRFATPADAKLLVKNGYVGCFALDTSHARSNPQIHPTDEILALIGAYGKKLQHIHISDTIMSNPHILGRARFHRAIGDGEIDWRSVFDKLDSASYDGYFIVETKSLDDTIKSKAYLMRFE